MQLACNIHGWMKAYVRVFDHPYYAVTDEDGKFEIKLARVGAAIHHLARYRLGAGREARAIRSTSRPTKCSIWVI